MNDFNRNVTLLRVISFFNAFSKLFALVLTTYFLSLGLSLFQMGLILSVVWGSSLVLEIPSGVISDKVGRKFTTVISNACLVIAIAMYLAFSTFELFVVAAVFYGAHKAFMSGSNTSLLLDSLKQLGRDGEFKKIRIMLFSDNRLAFLISGLIVGFIAVVSFKYVFIVGLAAGFISLISSLMLVEAGEKTSNSSKKHLVESIGFVFKNRKLGFTIAYFAILAAFLEMQKFHQAYYSLIGLPLEFFGIFFSLTVLFQFLFARKLEAVERLLGEKRVLILTPLVVALLNFALWANVQITSLAIFVLLGAAYTYRISIKEFEVSKFTSDSNRATVLSILGFFESLAIAVSSAFLGYIGSAFGVPAIFLATAIATLILIALPTYYLLKS